MLDFGVKEERLLRNCFPVVEVDLPGDVDFHVGLQHADHEVQGAFLLASDQVDVHAFMELGAVKGEVQLAGGRGQKHQIWVLSKHHA